MTQEKKPPADLLLVVATPALPSHNMVASLPSGPLSARHLLFLLGAMFFLCTSAQQPACHTLKDPTCSQFVPGTFSPLSLRFTLFILYYSYLYYLLLNPLLIFLSWVNLGSGDTSLCARWPGNGLRPANNVLEPDYQLAELHARRSAMLRACRAAHLLDLVASLPNAS